jgi:hypothetical protein
MSKKNCPICFSINPLLAVNCHCCFHVFNKDILTNSSTGSLPLIPESKVKDEVLPLDDESQLTYDELFKEYKDLCKEKHKLGRKFNIALDVLESIAKTDLSVNPDYTWLCGWRNTVKWLAQQTLDKIKK